MDSGLCVERKWLRFDATTTVGQCHQHYQHVLHVLVDARSHLVGGLYYVGGFFAGPEGVLIAIAQRSTTHHYPGGSLNA